MQLRRKNYTFWLSDYEWGEANVTLLSFINLIDEEGIVDQLYAELLYNVGDLK